MHLWSCSHSSRMPFLYNCSSDVYDPGSCSRTWHALVHPSAATQTLKQTKEINICLTNSQNRWLLKVPSNLCPLMHITHLYKCSQYRIKFNKHKIIPLFCELQLIEEKGKLCSHMFSIRACVCKFVSNTFPQDVFSKWDDPGFCHCPTVTPAGGAEASGRGHTKVHKAPAWPMPFAKLGFPVRNITQPNRSSLWIFLRRMQVSFVSAMKTSFKDTMSQNLIFGNTASKRPPYLCCMCISDFNL